MKRVCIFCGSSVGAHPSYVESARAIARLVAAQRVGIVYGGGNVGLMGVVADAAIEAGGEVIGVIPDGLVARELAHRGISRLEVVGSMHERKALMADLSDAFIALPGGFGTFEEFCEAVTWTQLGIHTKPCGLLNVDGYYDALLALFDAGVRQQFIRPENRRIVVAHSDPAALVDELARWRPVATQKWIGKDER